MRLRSVEIKRSSESTGNNKKFLTRVTPLGNNKCRMKKISSITGLFFCLLLLAHSSALAQTPSDTMTPAISRHPLKIKITPPGQERACQVKEEIIKRRFTKSINLVTQIITKFDSVAQRASDFYNQKLVPNG